MSSLDIEAASCWCNNQKNIKNVQQQQLPPQQQQFQLQGSSDQPIAYVPPEGITTFNFQQIPQQHQQPQLQYQQVRQALPSTSASSVTECPHQDLTSTTSVQSTTCTAAGGGQPPGIGGHHYFDINQLNRKHLRDLPRGSLRRWAILCDTGAATSVAPRNVKAPLLGLHDIFDSGIVLHINSKDSSSVEHQGENEPLYHRRSHLFIDATAFDIDHRVHHHWAQYIQQHGFYNDQHILTNSDEPQHLAGEAQQAQTLRSPILPSQQEQDAHSLTRQPYRSWCRVCQQAKGRGGQHRRQHQQEENISITQLNYTFMHDPHQAPQRTGRPTHLHDTYGHRVCNRTRIGGAYFKERLYATSSSTTTSLDHQAWIYKKCVAIRPRNILDAIGEHSRHRPQTSYKGQSTLLTSESRQGGEVPSKPL